MESQDLKKALIDYLYGEMTSSEKKAFEERISNDPELQKELDGLQGIRKDLGALKNKEVMEPFSISSNSQPGWFKVPRRRSILLHPVIAIAASIVIIMLVGFVTRFSVTINDKGFQMGFYQNASESQPSLTEADVKRMLEQEINNSNSQIRAYLDTTQSTFNTRVTGLEKRLNSSESKTKQVVTGDDLEKFFIQVQDRNAQLLQEYLNQTSTQQQAYFKTMLTQFNDYLQEQRAEDMNYMQTEMLELKYSQTQQKVETDQVLSGLINTVSQRQN